MAEDDLYRTGYSDAARGAIIPRHLELDKFNILNIQNRFGFSFVVQ